ncbi:MAG: hypothetical protein KatS3mg102_2454 [Planctomycetota bacterium]|nr:MAG: hypothetical protein KatS3mg102_2454 [Planctomycetota bacterium]
MLLVLGGSQGARPLNRALWQAAPMLAAAARRSGRPFELVHLAGDADAAPLAARYRACGLRAFVSPWLADMNAAYRAADLALCRAGGSTIAELLACALPAVLVPLPHAAGDHQRANALAAARRGAAWALEERELQRPAVLRAIVALLADPERLEPMRRAAAAAACIEAADRIAACILEETECR